MTIAPPDSGYACTTPMDEVEAAGLSPRALRAITLIVLALVGLAAGVGVYLWSTTPHAYSIPPPAPTSLSIPVSMDWRSSSQGWLVVHDAGGPESLVFRTMDGGVHWQREVSVSGPSSVRFTDARHGTMRVAAFSGGLQVLRTDDAGAHWRTVPLPELVPGTVATPFFLDANAGWLLSLQPVATGAHASVYHTEDAGRHWSPLPGPPDGLADLTFASTRVGWLTGTSTLLLTRDGGQVWTPQSLPAGSAGPRAGDPLEITPPVVSPNGRGALRVYDSSAGQGWVYATTDGGATWVDPRPLPWSVGDVRPAFVDGTTGWAFDSASAWVTVDSGRTWQSGGVLPQGWAFNLITPVSAAAAWATASESTAEGSIHLVTWGLFHTVDGGRHWTEARLPYLG